MNKDEVYDGASTIYVSLLSVPSNIVSSHECTTACCNCGGSDAVNRVWQPLLPKLLRPCIIDTTPLRKSLESSRIGHVVSRLLFSRQSPFPRSQNFSITCEHLGIPSPLRILRFAPLRVFCLVVLQKLEITCSIFFKSNVARYYI